MSGNGAASGALDNTKLDGALTWKAFCWDGAKQGDATGSYTWSASGAKALIATAATLYAASSMTF